MADFDIIIRDGILVDGTGAQRYRADVGIRNGRIAKIGRLGSATAGRSLDAGGMIVAPVAVTKLSSRLDRPQL